MRVACIGGGPAGLFFSILLKAARPEADVTLFERNRPDDTFGWGVVFSDQTLGNVAAADPATHAAIEASFVHWDDIDVHFRGRVLRAGGQGFAGIARRRLLRILQERAEALGVTLRYETEVNDDADPLLAGVDVLVVADGANSAIRRVHLRVRRNTLGLVPDARLSIRTGARHGDRRMPRGELGRRRTERGRSGRVDRLLRGTLRQILGRSRLAQQRRASQIALAALSADLERAL